MIEDYELVQVHLRGDEEAEVIIRNKNGFKAFGGILKLNPNPKSVYPPDYMSEEVCPRCKGSGFDPEDYHREYNGSPYPDECRDCRIRHDDERRDRKREI